MRHRNAVLVLGCLLVSSTLPRCNCDNQRLGAVKRPATCVTDPSLCPPADTIPQEDPPVIEDPPVVPRDPPPPPPDCAYGNVTGRVCATDQRTWVNGAEVVIEATDCDGSEFPVKAITDENGYFTLKDVPVGSWNVHAELGQFTQDIDVTVTADATTTLEEDQLCVAQKDVKIAVITGMGDKIEDLLDNLSLTYTLYSGKDQWSAQGEPFLRDLTAMQAYDIIFVNCGAARNTQGGSNVNLGTKAAQIQANLRAYVQAGGSLYASDWSLLFAYSVDSTKIDFATRTGAAIANGLKTNELMGYAPQNVTTQITEPSLSAFLGKSTVDINFPQSSSTHWGLMENIAADVGVLVNAPTVKLCGAANSNCDEGLSATNIPFAVRYKLTPLGQRGGWVTYTSFHNTAQTGDDVANILKFLILHL